MIAVTSNYLTRADSAMIRKYSKFVLNRMVRPCVQKRSKITIKVLGEQEIKDAYDEADRRLTALNNEMTRIMACNKDYEEQTAQLVTARDREISELISNRKKATTAAEKKLADVEAKLAAVEADIAKKQADFDAGVKAKTDAAEQALADIEKRRQAAESALEALRAKLG